MEVTSRGPSTNIDDETAGTECVKMLARFNRTVFYLRLRFGRDQLWYRASPVTW